MAKGSAKEMLSIIGALELKEGQLDLQKRERCASP
ncbi:hypothetical protein DFP98_1315 [Cohnella phaseoli]|uniref:Uncharacterized protein n=1 Tax=Cohnella phaseoli TaxID=456490 RepID=A0A3D9ICC0_9BACL|nr:hypothetical protein DFP98_1315 [Cohnella phaseoli]